jgi:short-subunit dehydrogenase
MPLNAPIIDWQDRRVWIVGASTGIGAALARQLDAAGARLALSARNAATLDGLAAEFRDAIALPLDVRDAGSLRDAEARIRATFGGIDVAVLNAGTYHAMRADEFSLAAMDEHFAVNWHGTVNALAALLPGMLKDAARRPALAVVASVAGYAGLPNALAYGPSKAALINLAETLYLDLAPRGIGVFLINPGFVDTPLTRQNTFHMPALISAEEAAGHIVAGFARGEFEIHFPKRFTRTMKALSKLPYAAYFRAVRKATGL